MFLSLVIIFEIIGNLISILGPIDINLALKLPKLQNLNFNLIGFVSLLVLTEFN
jgi:hypothetical protein